MKIKIGGEIVMNEDAWIYDFFDEPHFSPAMLDDAVQSADPDDREMIIEMNSPGGYVLAGFEIYSRIVAMRAEGWTVEAHVTALAASAASTIISACDTVLCSPVAQIMLHLPFCVTVGNRNDHQGGIEFLRSIEESILNGYVFKAKGKANREDFRKAMEKETWMSAQQAIAMGLADGLLGSMDAAKLTAADVGSYAGHVVNSLQAGIGHSYDDLVARYETGVRAGVLQMDPLHPVDIAEDPAPVKAESEPETAPEAEELPEDDSMQAWLDLEKLRYPE